MFNLQQIFTYLHFLDEFRKVKRVMYATGEERMENDMEHSYQLTMIAWYIMDTYKLDLDKDLVMRYCLVHDLVEVYAGDTYIYSQNKEHVGSKTEREYAAFLRMREELNEFSDMLQSIEQYEEKKDKESLFVYALDKIVPVLNIYMDKGRIWKEIHLTEIVVTIEQLRKHKDEKIRTSPELYEFWLQLIEILELNKKDLFLPE